MDLRTLRAFEVEVRRVCPEFKLGFKDQTFFQRVLGFLLPLNRTYLTKGATTVYPTVYFPSKKQYEAHPWASFLVLAHEMVHLVDMKGKPLARLSYLMPQLLAIFPLAAYVFYTREHAWPLAIVAACYLLGCIVGRKFLGAFYVTVLGGVVAAGVLAVLLTHWWSALLFSGLALLGPWPSPWRTNIEMRGYSMNVAITHWALGRVPAIYRSGVGFYFTGSSHYYTDWSGVNTRKRLDAVAEKAQSGELQREQPFAVVYSFMRRNKLLHAP
jgi:hypothetical protein